MKVLAVVIALALSAWSLAERRVVIDVSEQKAYWYNDDALIKTCQVSTGYKRKHGPKNKRGGETPRGVFHVLRKLPMAYSTKYGDAPMPHAVHFTGKVYLHACQRKDIKHLGSKASHGCVRLHPKTAGALFEWIQVGDTIEVRD